MTLIDIIFSNENSDSIIIEDDIRSFSKSELGDLISKCAFQLRSDGIVDFDRVAVEASNTIEFIVHYFALQLLKIPVFPYDSSTPSNMLAEQFDILGITRCAVVKPLDCFDGKERFPYCESEGDDHITTLCLTSGTTGRKKLVELSARKEYLIGKHIALHTGNDFSSSELLVMPLSHSFGLGRLRACIVAGSSIFLNVDFKRVLKVIKTIEGRKIKGIGLVPTAYRYILRVGGEKAIMALKGLDYIEFGSASFTNTEKKEIRENFAQTKVMMHYGMTEVSRALFLDIHNDPSDATARLGTGAEVTIDLNQGHDGNERKYGLIFVKAPWQAEPKKNELLDMHARIKRSSGSELNYINTGDIGYIKDNYLFVVGRNAFQINVGGKKVLPEEVEAVLNLAPYVTEVAVFGVKDIFQGEKIICYLLPQNDKFSMSDFSKYVSQNLPNHMVPSYYKVVSELPKSETGKILKNILIQAFEENDQN